MMAQLGGLFVLLVAINFASAEIKNVGWWKNAVFYQIYPRSFMDANNDGIGDLKGITEKLTHFKDAGVDAIWLSPIYASPMVDFGYDISDFRKIHPDYGTDADFAALMTKAKTLGIKVVMDLVPNHTSDEHEWFQKSLTSTDDYKDYYIWKDAKADGSPPNNWISVFAGSAWTCDTTRTGCYFHQFHRKQPDLNFRNEKVQKAMEDIITFWLEKGIDGFRVDAVPHLYEVEDLPDEPRTNFPDAQPNEYTYLDHIYTKDLNETYDLVASWKRVLDDYADKTNTDEKVMMTEAYAHLLNTTKYYDTGAQVPFNFFFITDLNKDSKPAAYKKVIDDWMAEVAKRPGAIANWVMGNHDRSRTASRFPDRGDQMTMLAMILPGVTVTYYGEEIGMLDKSDISFEETQDPQACQAGKDKYKEKSRDPNRTPMQWNDEINAGFNTGAKPWIPVHEDYTDINLQAQKNTNLSHYRTYQKLIQLKKNQAPVKEGSLKTIADDKTLTVIRTAGNENIILIINFSDSEEVQAATLAKVPTLDSTATVEATSLGSPIKAGDKVDLGTLKIAAKHSLVLSAKTKASGEKDGDGGGSATITVSSILSAFLVLLLAVELLH